MAHVQPSNPSGYARYLTPLPAVPRAGVRLRPLGAVVQLALLADVVAAVLMVVAVLHQRSLIEDAVDHPGTITVAQVQAADATAGQDVHLLLWAAAVTGIAFMVWLTIARHNAQRYDPYIHRHSTPWAVFGWVVPVVSFWFPYQITRDTLAASDREPTAWAGTPRYPLLRAWWTAWLVSVIGWRLLALHHYDTPDAFVVHADAEIVILACYLAAAVLAAVVVGRISGSNDRFRTKVQALATASAG